MNPEPNPAPETGGPAPPPPPRAAPAAVSLASWIGKVRHDLHNPLSDILGFSELLAEEAREAGHRHLIPEFQAIYQAASVVLKRVNQALDVQHLEANPEALDELRQTASAMFHKIMTTTESLAQKCVLLEDAVYGDDLVRISGSTRKLMELTPALLSRFTPAEINQARSIEAIRGYETELIEAPAVDQEAAPGATPSVPGSLLVVEDNDTNRVLLTRRLRRQGYSVAVAENGRQALRLLRARQFDLVLLDILMPEMNGYEVLAEMKSDPALRHIPVIMISGLDELESLVRCIQRGADDYLPKPFDPVLLGARIGAALEKKRLRDQEQVYLRRLQEEQEKSERLLLNVLPKPIAQRLKAGEHTIADHFADVTVVFADLVGFTPLSSQTSPTEVVRLLNEIFSAFDLLADKHGLEKVKTIGDSYMAVSGLPVPRPDHAEAVAEFALDLENELRRLHETSHAVPRMRIGINTGPVIAGIIGRNKFIYDLWGDTVNTASRMESQGRPGRIQVSEATYERLRDKYELRERGQIEVKGKGWMTTYYLIGHKAGVEPHQ